MERVPLGVEGFGYKVSSESADVSMLTKREHLYIVFAIRLIRRFEQELLELQKKGLLWGALHTSIGMECAASAALHALGKNSRVNSTHRGHHHVIAKALFALLDQDWDPLSGVGQQEAYEPVIKFLYKTFAEILGLRNGFCSGRGGSMHLYDPSVGVHGTNGIVGGALPTAVGLAFGALHNNTGEVIMTFFGDGASNQGTFHESCNLASIYRLPIIFFLENNQYAVGTKAQQVCGGTCLALRGISYGLNIFQVSADDPIAIHEVISEVKEAILAGGPPALVEAVGYRPMHHDSPLPGSAYGYRTKEEEAYWAVQSGYEKYPQLLIDSEIIADTQLDDIDVLVSSIIDQALIPLVGENKDAIQAELWPDPEQETRCGFVEKGDTGDPFFRQLPSGMRSSGDELGSLRYMDGECSLDSAKREISYVQAIAEVTGRWLDKDPTVYVWGEDVANFGQGPYGATKELMKKYPGRIINTPISESGFVGMALGASMMNIKPIVEIMFPDFVFVAADQLFNQIAKARYMYGGSVDLPLILRTRIATGTGMGPQHSMDPTALFSLFPGWRIIAPTNSADYIGLFNTAMTSKDPVLILEHHTLYRKTTVVPEEDLDYCIPFGSAKVVKKGETMTCVGYSGMIGKLIKVSELLGDSVSMEIIDLRSLDAPSIDYETIRASVEKTKDLVIFEEAPMSQSIGKHIVFNMLVDAEIPVRKKPAVINSLDVPMPVSRPLEAGSILSVDDIARYIKGRIRIV